ncbi:MAG: hypothetical protein WC120_01840 [Parcubacteria group bacterium]
MGAVKLAVKVEKKGKKGSNALAKRETVAEKYLSQKGVLLVDFLDASRMELPF